MGAKSTQLANAGAYAKSSAQFSIENINLSAVGAIVQTPNIAPDDTFVEIILLNGATADTSIATLLASGYIGSAHAVGWQGSLLGEPMQFININAWGLTPSTIMLTLLTE